VAIPIAVVPVTPFRNAAELISIAYGELSGVLEAADTSVIAPAELLLARETLLTIPDFMALAATPAIFDTSKIAIAARALLYPLLLLPPVAVGLEDGESALAATASIDTLCLTLLAATLDALRVAFTAAAAPFDALDLTFTATTAFGTLRLLAATAATAFGLLAASTATALGLSLTAIAAALVGLR
jgi:hypothetical protein